MDVAETGCHWFVCVLGMMCAMESAVGIDLGTTYSAVAILDQNNDPRTLLNSAGEPLTPSMMCFEGPRVVVGRGAAKAISTQYENVADCPKRDLGERVFRKVINGRQYPPEVLQAWILRKLWRDAQRQIGPLTKAVITVPAYFDEVRRKATMDAGWMAGIDVLDIINEPTAAALAFGIQQGRLFEIGQTNVPRRILVYDLGGGTFDVTVMEIDGGQYRTLATDGDMRLGGWDWDQRIVALVADELVRRIGFDPFEDQQFSGNLWLKCEQAKRELSIKARTAISFDLKGKSFHIELSREEFENRTRDLLDRTMFTVEQTLQEAGLEMDQLDVVLMVGGSTRMPSVVRRLRSISGKEPTRSLSPDEAVAHGAAIRAGMILSSHVPGQGSLNVKNVNSHSLGVVGMDPDNKQHRNGIVIPRNTSLPVVAKRTFFTSKPNQRSIKVSIVEGESANPADCSLLGKCSIESIPRDLPVRTPIEVSFRYEENGRLKVSVQVKGVDSRLTHQLHRENTLTQEQMEGWRDFIDQSCE